MKKIFFMIFSFFIMISTSFAFIDESDYYWAKDSIDKWSDIGIVSGYSDGTFRGNNKVTRAEAISIINKLNNSNEKITKRVAKDIKSSDWFFNDMGRAVASGIVSIDNNGNLRPKDFATREEVAVMIANLLKIKYSGNSYEYLASMYSDYASISYENLDKFAGTIKEGIIKGYNDGRLNPKGTVTRAELISMIDNAVDNVYSFGKHSNKVILGNIVINGEDVTLKNCNIDGKIYVLDGAKDSAPNLINTTATKGIVSRIGTIISKEDDNFRTKTEADENKPEKNEVVIASIKYSEDSWTNDDVTATLKFSDNDCKIINNDGNRKYEFRENGEFTFECDNNGDRQVFTAKVTWIDKVKPEITATSTVDSDEKSATVTVTVVSEDGLSPIEGTYYSKGSVSGSSVILGTKFTENTFTVIENGVYTIGVKDAAGNVGKTTVSISGLKEGSINPPVIPDIPVDPDTPEIPEDTNKPNLPSRGAITWSPDGIGGTGNGEVEGNIITFSGTIPYNTSSTSDKVGNWIGVKIIAPDGITVVEPKVYADGELVEFKFNEDDNSLIYYENAVIGKKTKINVIWNNSYKSDEFYIKVADDATLETSNIKMVTIDPNGGRWNGSSKVQNLNADNLELIKIVDPENDLVTVTFDENTGVIAGDKSVTMNVFTGWMLEGAGSFNGGYYTFGDGTGTLKANYLTEIVLPEAKKEGYVHTGWFSEVSGGEFIGNAGDKYILPNKDTTLYAQFEIDIFTLTVITEPRAAGSVNGARNYHYKDIVTLVADPIVGYEFDSWIVNGITVSPDDLEIDTLTFTMPAREVNIVANFAEGKKIKANKPVLTKGLVPVNWNGEEFVETDEENWDYNYIPVSGLNSNGTVEGNGGGKWANARTRDGSMYVWIPRYSYKIISGENKAVDSWNSDEATLALVEKGKITIKFSDGTKDYTEDGYMVHPAFTFGTDELDGFWVMKYEASLGNTNEEIKEPSIDKNVVKSIPDADCLVGLNIGDAFDYSYNSFRNADSHLIKNTEWGAVTYLTNAIGRVPYINNIQKTGNSGDNQSAKYNSGSNMWNTEKGVKASTTHNVYGIYDMSGGAAEYVSAYGKMDMNSVNQKGNSLIKAIDKYVDIYNSNYGKINGDSIFETSEKIKTTSWDGDNFGYLSTFYIRGGAMGDEKKAGIFAFNGVNDETVASFRTVLAPNTYTITVDCGENGSINLDTETNIKNGESRTYIITPNENYMINDVKVDGVSQGPISSYTFDSITESHSIKVSFEPRKIYAIRRGVNSETSLWERVEDSVGLIANATKDGTEVQNDFDNIYPWSNIKSYNYNTDLEMITAWYGEENFKFDGSNGEVLTYIPMFYYKHIIEGDYEYYYITKSQYEDYIKSEEFSVGRYKMSEVKGKARSYSGSIPSVNKNITQHRNLAKSLGENFGQLDWRYFTIQMLYLVEYGDYDSQNVLGKGISSLTYVDTNKALIDEFDTNRIIISGVNGFIIGQQIDIGKILGDREIATNRNITSIEEYKGSGITGVAIIFDGEAINVVKDNIIYSCPQKVGQCNQLGMKSGSLINDGKHSVIYRGIEDIFGNVTEWIDGINFNNSDIYICYEPEKYAVDIFSNDYKKLNYSLPKASGYIEKLTFDNNHPLIGMLGLTGKSVVGDYFKVSEKMVVLSGLGQFFSGNDAGLWNLDAYYSATSQSVSMGARILKY